MLFNSSSPVYDMEIGDYDTSQHLANAKKQADERGFKDVLIVDADCHHYETDNLTDIIDYIGGYPCPERHRI